MTAEPTVQVVDDDPAVRDGLAMLLRSAGLAARCHPDADAFLAEFDPEEPGCLVADLRMPGMSGIELHEKLRASGHGLPTIILTGHGDVTAAVRALKGGALDFIEKPFDADVLLERVRQAIERDARARAKAEREAAAARRVDWLTAREREVMRSVAAGKANKVIAVELGISERTVEQHRGRVMRKMEVRSVAGLVRILARL